MERSTAESREERISIVVIVVLYQMRPSESPTLRSLTAALNAAEMANLRVAVLIADNTPGGDHTAGELPLGARYRGFADNPGLAVPYNAALQCAEDEGFDWLLTLDQDTRLPESYFRDLAGYVAKYATQGPVAAIVPRIVDRGVPISPFRYLGGFLPRMAGPKAEGILGRHASAVNSSSLLRVSALRTAGGYDERFPLNNSDTALFHRLDLAGFRVALAGSIVVQHELAIMRRSERMSVRRYEELLRDERDFWDLHMGALARAERLVRLMGRVARSTGDKDEAEFRRLAIEEIRRRLFRGKRIEAMPSGGVQKRPRQSTTGWGQGD